MANTGPILFNDTLFKAMFPEFGTVPEPQLQAMFDIGITIITNDPYGPLTRDSRTSVLNYLVAHILKLTQDTAAGKLAGLVTGASQSNVSITVAAPPFGTSQFEYWLGQTSYGAIIAVTLQAHSVTGFMVGGGLNQAGFRGPAGGFPIS